MSTKPKRSPATTISISPVISTISVSDWHAPQRCRTPASRAHVDLNRHEATQRYNALISCTASASLEVDQEFNNAQSKDP
jgi:hypothetical protein